MDISTVSGYDFVTLVAHYNDAWDGSKNNISADASKRGYTPEQLDHVLKQITAQFNPIESCGLRFTKPFGNLKFDLFGYVLILFENYERGCLPFPGTISEQPGQIMEIFSVIKQLKYELDSKAKSPPRIRK